MKILSLETKSIKLGMFLTFGRHFDLGNERNTVIALVVIVDYLIGILQNPSSLNQTTTVMPENTLETLTGLVL